MKILLPESLDYPRALLKIKKPPKKIWIEGNEKLLNQKGIAIVGSRKCTEYGEKWCEIFTKGLIEYDFVIVSGMAIGIDSIAHKTAIKFGGKTIAVLPSGLANIYPKQNTEIYKQIIKNGGAVITEYSPNIEGCKERFLERNRIVSGLALGTLVVEASKISGTSITAKITQKEGKKVFCIPGSLDNPKSTGTNIMLKKGAELVTSVEDIVSNYGITKKMKILKEENNFILETIDEEYRDLYKLICKGPININKLANLSNLSISEVIGKIAILEIDGKINRNEKGEICLAKN